MFSKVCLRAGVGWGRRRRERVGTLASGPRFFPWGGAGVGGVVPLVLSLVPGPSLAG